MPTDKIRCNGITHIHCRDGCEHVESHTVSNDVDEGARCAEGYCYTTNQEVYCEPVTHGGIIMSREAIEERKGQILTAVLLYGVLIRIIVEKATVV